MAYSSAEVQNLYGTAAAEPLLSFLEITHPDLSVPVRVVADTQDITVTENVGGAAVEKSFIACPFKLALPDDVDQQMPTALLTVDNIGRDLTTWLEFSRGGAGAKCRVTQALRSAVADVNAADFGPYASGYFASSDYVSGADISTWRTWGYDLTLDMSGMKIDNLHVTATLGFESTLGQASVTVRFDPVTAPGAVP